MTEDTVKVDGPKSCPCFGSVSMEEGFLGKAISQALRVVSKEQSWMDGHWEVDKTGFFFFSFSFKTSNCDPP